MILFPFSLITGRLIITTSDCAQYALPGLAVYGASKAAQEAWARGLRLEVAKYGVSVVCYQPGKTQFGVLKQDGHF